jgi:hypothetical protein
MICCTEPGQTYALCVLYIQKTRVTLKYKKKENEQILLTVTDKKQTRTHVREGARQRQDSNFLTELISGRKSRSGLDTKTYPLTEYLRLSPGKRKR